MKSFLAPNAAAIIGTVIMPRDFIAISVKDRTTGAVVVERLWSETWDITAQVRDVDTGGVAAFAFQGAAGLVKVDEIPMVSTLEVAEIVVSMAAYGVDIDRIFRLYDPTLAPIRIWRGFLNTETRRLVGAAEPLFIGNIDRIELPTGAEGSEATATMTCVSGSQEMTRYNPDLRTDVSQRRRHPTDNFFQDVNALREREFFWGRSKESAAPPNPIDLLPRPPITLGSV